MAEDYKETPKNSKKRVCAHDDFMVAGQRVERPRSAKNKNVDVAPPKGKHVV